VGSVHCRSGGGVCIGGVGGRVGVGRGVGKVVVKMVRLSGQSVGRRIIFARSIKDAKSTSES
jgi:hypothetical protein